MIAHQSGDGIWPGNTMYAFEKAVEIGADVLEMDAHLTKDGQIVLMHDEELDRTKEGSGLIEKMTLEELKQLDAAYRWSNDEEKTFPYRGHPGANAEGTLSRISADALYDRDQAHPKPD